MKYIIFVAAVAGMGGGQLYCAHKVAELRRRGYQVFVFSGTNGTFFDERIKEFSDLIIPELRCYPRFFSKSAREKVLSTIERKVGGIDSETIIDSAEIYNAEWGEILAARHGCKHIVFTISEYFSKHPGDIDFMQFKLNRKELYGSSIVTIPRMFEGVREIEPSKEYKFSPLSWNEVVDSTYPFQRRESSKTICIFGNLEKTYVRYSLINLLPLFTAHSDVEFDVIVLGGAHYSEKRKMRQLRRLVHNIRNVRLTITGFLSPLPKSLFQQMDVCVASAGCVSVAVGEGVPCIAVNSVSGDVTGIPEFTYAVGTTDTRYGSSGMKLKKWIEEILFRDYCRKTPKKYPYVKPDRSALVPREIDSQAKRIMACTEREYYDVETIWCKTWKDLVGKSICFLFGASMYNWLIHNIWIQHVVPHVIQKRRNNPDAK